jgi:undecaprenyl-diphosphatase
MSEQTTQTTVDTSDPILAQASPSGWRAWLIALATSGRDRLAALGLALVLGFLAGGLALVVFAAIADDVSDGETERLDNAVLTWLQQFQSATVDVTARAASAMGSEVLGVLLIVLVGVFIWRRRWGAATALVLTTLGAQLLNDLLKDLFQRTRPAPVVGLISAQSFSFPSGHAMVSAAFYGYLTYVAWRLLAGWQRWLVVGVLTALVFLIGLSRLYLGVHYLTDVVAGYIAGFLWTDAVIVGGHLLQRRRRRRRTSSAARSP